MNASADGDEPMGEHPELTTMPHAVSLIDRQAAALAAIRALHTPMGSDALRLFGQCCSACSIERAGIAVQYPCPTVRILEKHGVA